MRSYSNCLCASLNCLLIICFLSIKIACAEESPGQTYTIESSIKEAFQNNWGIKEKQEKVEESRYAKKQARADLLPRFSTSYGYTRLGEVNSITFPAVPGFPGGGGAIEMGYQNNYQWQGNIVQPIFTGFALISAYDLAKLGIDKSKIDLELEKLDLALNVKAAYYNILKADKAVDVAERAVESLKSHLKVARNFYEVGMIPVNDLLKAEVELANAQHNLTKAKNAAQLSRASFNMLLSRPIDSMVDIESILTYDPESPSYKEYYTRALESRPEIKALDINDMQIDKQITLAKSKYFPEVSLTYTYTKAGNKPDVNGSFFHDSSTWQAMAGLSWTFWNWGRDYYSVQQKESMKRQLSKIRSNLEEGHWS